MAGIAILVLLLFSCPAVSAIIIQTPTPTPGIIDVRPVSTIVPLQTLTTTPEPDLRTVPCDAGSQCMFPNEAVATWGDGRYIQTSGLPCAYSTATFAAPHPKYCYQQKTDIVNIITPVTTQVIQIATPFIPATHVIATTATTLPVQQATPVVITTTTIDPGMLSLKPCLGREECNGVCIDTRGSDPANCGGCGWVCPSGMSCSAGECVFTCPSNTLECQPGYCVYIGSDNDNCGECGMQCSNREICMSGNCRSLCSINPTYLNEFSWHDWQGINWMSTVKDQAGCGSCWAYAAAGTAEGVLNIEGQYQYPHGYNLDLSEQALVSGCYGNHGSCLGGDATGALTVLRDRGVAEEVFMPYQSFNCVTMDEKKDKLVCNANIIGHCSIPGQCTLGTVPSERIWKVASFTREADDNAATTN
ncbi:C1 family peptidase, partial [Methanoregula sp.]|uniref:C1 family peptidase n=1 Tax=Methanoregula sp. TaxID=2052170 RepID=UPI0025D275C8